MVTCFSPCFRGNFFKSLPFLNRFSGLCLVEDKSSKVHCLKVVLSPDFMKVTFQSLTGFANSSEIRSFHLRAETRRFTKASSCQSRVLNLGIFSLRKQTEAVYLWPCELEDIRGRECLRNVWCMLCNGNLLLNKAFFKVCSVRLGKNVSQKSVSDVFECISMFFPIPFPVPGVAAKLQGVAELFSALRQGFVFLSCRLIIFDRDYRIRGKWCERDYGWQNADGFRGLSLGGEGIVESHLTF